MPSKFKLLLKCNSMTCRNFSFSLSLSLQSFSVPHSAYKEMVTSKMPTLRSLNSKLRQDANRLASEVDGLSNEIDLLEPEADR